MKVNLTIEISDRDREIVAASEGKRGKATRGDIRDLLAILLRVYCQEFKGAPSDVIVAAQARRK